MIIYFVMIILSFLYFFFTISFAAFVIAFFPSALVCKFVIKCSVIIIVISNGNRTECSPIGSVIIRVAGVRFV